MPKIQKSASAPQNQTKLMLLSKEITKLQSQVDLMKRNERAKQRRQKSLIPRPAGRPGRRPGKGYKLIKVMGLEDKRKRYNYIAKAVRTLAIKHLDTTRTIRQQSDRLLVEKVIRQAQLQFKELLKYENGWPVRDLLAQYLRNSSQAEKKETARMQHRKDKKKVVDVSDGEFPASGLESTDEDALASDVSSDSDDEEQECDEKGGDDEDDARYDIETDNESEETDQEDVRRTQRPSKYSKHFKDIDLPQKRSRTSKTTTNDNDNDDADEDLMQRPSKHSKHSKHDDRPQKRRRTNKTTTDDDDDDTDEDRMQRPSKPSKPSKDDDRHGPQKRPRTNKTTTNNNNDQTQRPSKHSKHSKHDDRPQKRRHTNWATTDDDTDDDQTQQSPNPSEDNDRPQMRQSGLHIPADFYLVGIVKIE